MHFHLILHHIERNIGHVQEVVGEVLFNNISLITAADDKVVNTVGRVELHDVPKNGFATNFNHWFWLEM